MYRHNSTSSRRAVEGVFFVVNKAERNMKNLVLA